MSQDRRVILWAPDGRSHAALDRESTSALTLIVYTATPTSGTKSDRITLDARQLKALGIRLEKID